MKMTDEEKIAPYVKSDHTYRDRLMRRLFDEECRMIELCNAIMGTDYGEDVVAKRYDLDNSLTRRYNDMAIGIDDKLLLVIEHQSKISPNMPLRLFGYVAELLSQHFIQAKKLYGSTLFKIPTPKLYVLYNGKEPLEQTVIRLSSAFMMDDDEVSLELVVNVIDVNFNSGHYVLEKSPSLNGYAYLIKLIGEYLLAERNRDVAISWAIKQCIREDVLKGFLVENFEEVAEMLYMQYDQEVEVQVLVEERLEEAIEIGIERGMKNIALKMLARNENLQVISDDTGLSIDEILLLKNGG